MASDSEFFRFGEDHSDRRMLRVKPGRVIESPPILLGEKKLPADLKFEHERGSVVRDLVPGSSVAFNLVSPRFCEALERAGVDGWSSIDIGFEDNLVASHPELVGYRLLVVRGRSGPIDDNLSTPVKIPAPTPRGRAASGLRGSLFHEHTWDGTDIFSPAGTIEIDVTGRVRDLCVDEGFNGMEFRRIDEIDRPLLPS